MIGRDKAPEPGKPRACGVWRRHGGPLCSLAPRRRSDGGQCMDMVISWCHAVMSDGMARSVDVALLRQAALDGVPLGLALLLGDAPDDLIDLGERLIVPLRDARVDRRVLLEEDLAAADLDGD